MDITLLLTALGLALVLESLPWLLAPQKMRLALLALLTTGENRLQAWGLFLLVAGVALVCAARW